MSARFVTPSRGGPRDAHVCGRITNSALTIERVIGSEPTNQSWVTGSMANDTPAGGRRHRRLISACKWICKTYGALRYMKSSDRTPPVTYALRRTYETVSWCETHLSTGFINIVIIFARSKAERDAMAMHKGLKRMTKKENRSPRVWSGCVPRLEKIMNMIMVIICTEFDPPITRSYVAFACNKSSCAFLFAAAVLPAENDKLNFRNCAKM